MPLTSKRKKRLTVILMSIALVLLFYSIVVVAGLLITNMTSQNSTVNEASEISQDIIQEDSSPQNQVGNGFMYFIAVILIVIAIFIYRYRFGYEVSMRFVRYIQTLSLDLKNRYFKKLPVKKDSGLIQLQDQEYTDEDIIKNIYN